MTSRYKVNEYLRCQVITLKRKRLQFLVLKKNYNTCVISRMINLYHDTVFFKSFEHQGDYLEQSTDSTSRHGGPI